MYHLFNNSNGSQAYSQKYLSFRINFKLTFNEELDSVFKKVNATIVYEKYEQKLLR